MGGVNFALRQTVKIRFKKAFFVFASSSAPAPFAIFRFLKNNGFYLLLFLTVPGIHGLGYLKCDKHGAAKSWRACICRVTDFAEPRGSD